MVTRASVCFAVIAVLMGCGGSGASVSAGPMPEGGSFSGVYFSPQYGEMNFIQNGSALVGEYKQDERAGKIQGEVDGDLLKFEWVERKAMVSNRPQETRGRGYFRYMVDASNGEHLIKGRWGVGDDDTGGGEWNAYKSKKREPHLSSESSGESSSGGEQSSDPVDSEPASSGSGSSDDDDMF
jgi:hypothetical protein